MQATVMHFHYIYTHTHTLVGFFFLLQKGILNIATACRYTEFVQGTEKGNAAGGVRRQ